MAVATDVLNLRVFSTGGVQKGLLSLPGPVLTMAGFQQKLAVAFQGGLSEQSTVDTYSDVDSLQMWANASCVCACTHVSHYVDEVGQS